MVSGDQPISPPYTPCISVSRIKSVLRHRYNSPQTNSVNYSSFSHVLILPKVEIRYLEEKTQHIENQIGVMSTLTVAIEPI